MGEFPPAVKTQYKTLHYVYVDEESHTDCSAVSLCECPPHCEKQLHYLEMQSLSFLHSLLLSDITGLNKRLNVDSVLG